MSKEILPGATLGVLGGGQLGRMFCVAARSMGYRTLVMDPDKNSPAGRVADAHIRSDYRDEQALAQMASQCDVITTEFENIPASSLCLLAKSTLVHPSAEALEIAQNRNIEKQFALKSGLMPVPYFTLETEADCVRAQTEMVFPAILKSNCLGYDGKGQLLIKQAGQLIDAFRSLGKVGCVLEKQINLSCEISAIVARNNAGAMQCFPVSENQHRNGVLHLGIVPARVSDAVAARARKLAMQLAEALNYVGILAVEFFLSDDNLLYFNEMAPRPHNSGHYTKDACVTSQFEQQVRMICGLSPGNTRLLSPVVMVNMLGDLWVPDWMSVFQHDNIKLHLYGKTEARQGRKMGHFNVLDNDIGAAIKTAEAVFEKLSR